MNHENKECKDMEKKVKKTDAEQSKKDTKKDDAAKKKDKE